MARALLHGQKVGVRLLPQGDGASGTQHQPTHTRLHVARPGHLRWPMHVAGSSSSSGSWVGTGAYPCLDPAEIARNARGALIAACTPFCPLRVTTVHLFGARQRITHVLLRGRPKSLLLTSAASELWCDALPTSRRYTTTTGRRTRAPLCPRAELAVYWRRGDGACYPSVAVRAVAVMQGGAG